MSRFSARTIEEQEAQDEARTLLTRAGADFLRCRAEYRRARAALNAAAIATYGVITEREAGRLAGVSTATIGDARRP
jgi:hypothetical protein